MKRYPVYFLVDVSLDSKQYNLIEVENTIKKIISIWRCDSYILEHTDISLFACSHKVNILQSRVALDEDIHIPILEKGKDFSFHMTFNCLKEHILKNVEKCTLEHGGDRIPLIISFVDLEKLKLYFNQNTQVRDWFRTNSHFIVVVSREREILGDRWYSIKKIHEIDSNWISRLLSGITSFPYFYGKRGWEFSFNEENIRTETLPKSPKDIFII